MFGWLRNRRRRKLLAEPFPAEWLEALNAHVWQYACLTEPEQVTLRDRLRVFVAEKYFEGCGGVELTDEIRVTIAAYACLLTLRLDPESYDHVISVLVYPDDYVAPQTVRTKKGFEREEMSHRMGEAWSMGTVILSWADLRDRPPGSNVAIHEFAHQLDMLNQSVDGTPPLSSGAAVERWRSIMTAQYEQLVARLDRGQPTFLNPYGATNPAELFAVCSEHFFEEPADMQRERPALYSVLAGYYAQDPASTWSEEEAR